MTIYNQEGVTVRIIDNEAVSISVEGKHTVEMTLDEFKEIAYTVFAEVG